MCGGQEGPELAAVPCSPQGLAVRTPPSSQAPLCLCCCSSWALPSVPTAAGPPGHTPRRGERWLIPAQASGWEQGGIWFPSRGREGLASLHT